MSSEALCTVVLAILLSMDPTTVVLAIVLSTLVGDFLLDVIASVLNYRALGQELPSEFAGLYDKAKYDKSQEYTRTKTVFGLAHSTFDLAVLLGFWFALRGFEQLDVFVRATFPGDDPWAVVPRGLLYIVVLIAASSALDLPWEIYSTFIIEERCGFNKTTPRTFVLDRVKSLLLAAFLGLPLSAAAGARTARCRASRAHLTPRENCAPRRCSGARAYLLHLRRAGRVVLGVARRHDVSGGALLRVARAHHAAFPHLHAHRGGRAQSRDRRIRGAGSAWSWRAAPPNTPPNRVPARRE